MILILNALEVMTLAHHGQVRKYSKAPYAVHPMRVMRKLEMFFEESKDAFHYIPKRNRMLIVAALHDVLEDTPYPKDEMIRRFGESIAADVEALTNPSKKHPEFNRKKRKEMDLQHLKGIPDHCKIIKLCDRWDNITDMPADDPFFLEVYIPETHALLDAIGEIDGYLAEKIRYTIVNVAK